LQLTGLVQNSGELKLADIQAFPKTLVTTDAQAGQGRLGSHTYAGALLYDVLQKAQIKTDAARKNDILRKAVLVTGTDKYAVAVSLGEILPRFAAKKILLAYEQDGKALPAKDGFVRLIVPGDAFAGRYVSNIAKIEVRDAGTLPKLGERTTSSTLYVLGAVKTPSKYDLNALKALKTTNVTVQGQDQNGQSSTTTYGGVLLTDLLTNAGGVQLKASSKNDFLRKGIVAVGTDGYSCMVVGGEIDAHFAHTSVLVATSMNGSNLPASDGFARLIVPGDQAMGRFVSTLTELQVVDFNS
jgi:DMSO/TMAO reductase YedYZ molybdopterin-dependent catalytic subunit